MRYFMRITYQNLSIIMNNKWMFRQKSVMYALRINLNSQKHVESNLIKFAPHVINNF